VATSGNISHATDDIMMDILSGVQTPTLNTLDQQFPEPAASQLNGFEQTQN
jgi:hypothetical protein